MERGDARVTGRIRRLALCALALALVFLSVGPVALCASHHGHFRMSCNCAVCTVIRDNLAILNAVATAIIVLILFRVTLPRVRETICHAVAGCRALPPVALKVRLND